MRLFCVALVCTIIFSGGGIAQNTDNPSVAVGQAPDASAKPATKPKRVWTNDDFGPSPQSPGEAAPSARRSSARRFSDAAIFLNPRDGDVVQPGDVLLIKGSAGNKMGYIIHALQALQPSQAKAKDQRNAI